MYLCHMINNKYFGLYSRSVDYSFQTNGHTIVSEYIWNHGRYNVAKMIIMEIKINHYAHIGKYKVRVFLNIRVLLIFLYFVLKMQPISSIF